MSVSDLAIVAVLIFGSGALSARLERFDVTAPIAVGRCCCCHRCCQAAVALYSCGW